MSNGNESYVASSEMRTLQCTNEVRDKVLLFVDQMCIDRGIGNPIIQKPIPSRNKAEQQIPKLYRITGVTTILLCVCGFVLMFIDAIYSILNLNSSVYIVWCLCCLSLFFTNKSALAEWKLINEGQRESS